MNRDESDDSFEISEHFKLVSELIWEQDTKKILKEIRFVNKDDLEWIQPAVVEQQVCIHRKTNLFLCIDDQLLFILYILENVQRHIVNDK